MSGCVNSSSGCPTYSQTAYKCESSGGSADNCDQIGKNTRCGVYKETFKPCNWACMPSLWQSYEADCNDDYYKSGCNLS